MDIGVPYITKSNNCAVFNVPVKINNQEKTLWYSVDKQYEDYFNLELDSILVALLIPAMYYGKDIVLDGGISRKQLFNLENRVQELLCNIMPFLQKVKIKPKSIIDEKHRAGTGVATGLSCGIDSYSALYEHFYKQDAIDYKVTHLLFNNVGSHGEAAETLFHDRFLLMEKVAKRLNLPIIKVDSNLDEFYNEKIGFQQTHTLRNLSVPLLLSKEIGAFLYSSAYHYEDVNCKESDAIAHADLILLPMLSSMEVEALSVGSEYTRVDKTKLVCNIADSYDTLDVCADEGIAGLSGNCSICWKCMRTQLTLEIAGKLDKYKDVFDFEKYKARRTQFIGNTLRSKSPLEKEIVVFAKDAGFRFPLKSKLYAKFYYLYRLLKAPIYVLNTIKKNF